MIDRDEDAPERPGDEAFLSRWSRRKRAVREGAGPEPEPDAAAVPDDAARAAPAPEPPPLTDADMPPLESLDESSDYAGFLSPGVSRDLRRAALRKLFASAAFNVVDGLDDYAEDFTTFEPLGEVITADAAGRRAREVLERARAQAGLPAGESPRRAEGEMAEGEMAEGAGDEAAQNEAVADPAAPAEAPPGAQPEPVAAADDDADDRTAAEGPRDATV